MKQLIPLFAFVLLMSACASSKKVAYFQDIQPNAVMLKEKGNDIRIQPKDMLSITVSSKDPELAALFNLQNARPGAGSYYQQSNDLEYTVNSEGTIDFPILGKLHVSGLTREEVGSLIKETLITQNLLKDPIVTVRFTNLTFAVMGEVSKPGQYAIDKDQITVLEALSKAGDLTIWGKRDHVFLIRESNGERIAYRMDLSSTQIYHSPAFYIQQNDIIYVEPNKTRANQSTANGNSVRTVSLWMSIASFLTTIGVLIFK